VNAPEDAVAVASRLTGAPARNARPLGGAVYAVDLDGRDPVVAKRHPEPGAAAAEAASLAWLGEADAVPVPAVFGNSGPWLVTAYLAGGRPDPAAADRLGRELAALHAAGAPAFGAAPPGGPVDAWIGLAPMRNEPGPAWPEWYAEHRVRPYLRRAIDDGDLGRADAEVVERVCARIGGLAGPAEPPARLHGDLWNGNVHWAADGRAWLMDPAAHGGHRETDLAMLRLFGCPHLERVLAAYDEAAPLADGWRARVPLHQLFPLLVHTVLFGGGYGGQAVAAARQALAAG
jgi:fructosamine-3-kinase